MEYCMHGIYIPDITNHHLFSQKLNILTDREKGVSDSIYRNAEKPRFLKYCSVFCIVCLLASTINTKSALTVIKRET